MKRRSVWICLLLFGLTGCYTFRPVPVEEVPQGAAVRARLSAAEAERQATILGRESRVVQGRLLGQENGGVVLQVRSVSEQGAAPLHQRLTVPPGGLLEIELRQLDRVRTAGAVAVLAAGVVAAALQVADGVRAKPGTEIDEPEAVRIPLIRLR